MMSWSIVSGFLLCSRWTWRLQTPCDSVRSRHLSQSSTFHHTLIITGESFNLIFLAHHWLVACAQSICKHEQRHFVHCVTESLLMEYDTPVSQFSWGTRAVIIYNLKRPFALCNPSHEFGTDNNTILGICSQSCQDWTYCASTLVCLR